MVSVTEVEDQPRSRLRQSLRLPLWVSVTQEEIDEGLAALNGASGYLRKLLAASIKLRITPKLSFSLMRVAVVDSISQR